MSNLNPVSLSPLEMLIIIGSLSIDAEISRLIGDMTSFRSKQLKMIECIRSESNKAKSEQKELDVFSPEDFKYESSLSFIDDEIAVWQIQMDWSESFGSDSALLQMC